MSNIRLSSSTPLRIKYSIIRFFHSLMSESPSYLGAFCCRLDNSLARDASSLLLFSYWPWVPSTPRRSDSTNDCNSSAALSADGAGLAGEGSNAPLEVVVWRRWMRVDCCLTVRVSWRSYSRSSSMVSLGGCGKVAPKMPKEADSSGPTGILGGVFAIAVVHLL